MRGDLQVELTLKSFIKPQDVAAFMLFGELISFFLQKSLVCFSVPNDKKHTGPGVRLCMSYIPAHHNTYNEQGCGG